MDKKYSLGRRKRRERGRERDCPSGIPQVADQSESNWLTSRSPLSSFCKSFGNPVIEWKEVGYMKEREQVNILSLIPAYHPQPYMHGILHNVICLSKVENNCRETKRGPPFLKYYLQCLTFHYASESPSWIHSVLPRCPGSLSLSFPLLLGQLPADDSELTPSPGIALNQGAALRSFSSLHPVTTLVGV